MDANQENKRTRFCSDCDEGMELIDECNDEGNEVWDCKVCGNQEEH